MDLMTTDERLLDLTEVQRLVPASEATVAKWRRLGHFPSPVRLPGSRLLLWRASDVQQWIKALPTVGSSEAA